MLSLVEQVQQVEQADNTLRDTFAGLSAAVALIALALAAYNLWQSKRRDRRDLFISIHVSLLEPEVAAGRRALYKITNETKAKTATRDEEMSSHIYRALAMFDLMALYAEEKWIDKKTVRKEWGYSIVNTQPCAKLWIAERYKDRDQWHSWEHYQALADRLAKDSSITRVSPPTSSGWAVASPVDYD